ncbi:MAG: hypoxanthine phosphoribosyltransferase [Clostridia bacterium]|nr:hypoxanthine phosphoribosyltransferase [Clostridia bacterium]
MILDNDLEKILISKEQIQKRVAELGQMITIEYAKDPDPIVLVCILKGSVVFFSDLMRQIDHDCRLDFMIVKSYGAGTDTSGNVRFVKDLDGSITGKHVIIVEDIIDSGNTLTFLRGNLITRGAKTLRICTLLDKPDRRSPRSNITVDYCGFTIPNEFVVGYGLDFDEKYRNMPDIGILKPEVYRK